jgi:GNAT superfamily N-acetyltransferase
MLVDNAKLSVAKLAPTHDLADFDSGSQPLDRYLQLHALQSQRANIAQTYVALQANQVIGYYSLVVGAMVYDDAPERLVRGTPRHPVPIILLARLAVDQAWQGRGVGAAGIRNRRGSGTGGACQGSTGQAFLRISRF